MLIRLNFYGAEELCVQARQQLTREGWWAARMQIDRPIKRQTKSRVEPQIVRHIHWEAEEAYFSAY